MWTPSPFATVINLRDLHPGLRRGQSPDSWAQDYFGKIRKKRRETIDQKVDNLNEERAKREWKTKRRTKGHSIIVGAD